MVISAIAFLHIIVIIMLGIIYGIVKYKYTRDLNNKKNNSDVVSDYEIYVNRTLSQEVLQNNNSIYINDYKVQEKNDYLTTSYTDLMKRSKYIEIILRK